jgi:hypothetical protein
MKKLLVLASLLLTLASENGFAQFKYFEDSFYGGVTAAGYAPTYNAGGTGTINISIPAGSTMRKAFLIAGRHGNAANITVTLNAFSYTFSSSNLASPAFQSPSYGGTSGVHVIDVTADIDPTVTNYSLVVPAQGGPSNRYNDFVLWVAYNNNSMTQVNTAIFLNAYNFSPSITYTLNMANALNNTYPVAVSVMAGYVCDNGSDGEKVKIGAYNLGTIGNHDINSGTCGGPLGSFAYSNNVLTGLSDDGNNLSMSVADALSDVKSKVTNGSSSFTMDFVTSSAGNSTNAIWAVFVTNGNSTTLPVELTNFTGVAEGSVNHLNWETSSETNCARFDVERSADGYNFENIGTVQGAGNSTATNYYTYTDVHPYISTTYYRLKQSDFDGSYQYSSVINISNLNYTVSSVDVYTLHGQVIASFEGNASPRELQSLAPGLYLLHYNTSRGLVVKRIMCRESQEPLIQNQ